jgi:transporter family-2 protein
MYYFLSVLTAILIAVMVVVNGELTNAYDIYSATVIIHMVGLILVSGIVAYKQEKVFSVLQLPWTLLLGGAIGVATTLFNNFAFGKISVSAIVALGLLGQTVTALVIDQFGLFDMPVRKFNQGKLVGLLFSAFGVVYLLSGLVFLMLPVALSLLTGVSIVISRSINARLAEKTSAIVSTWYNYVIGLVVACIIFLIAGRMGLSIPTKISWSLWIYWGGVIGVFVVMLSNIATPKIPAFQMTLILFAGQIFTGLVLDALLSHGFSQRNLIGGIFVMLGLSINLWFDKKAIRDSKWSLQRNM